MLTTSFESKIINGEEVIGQSVKKLPCGHKCLGVRGEGNNLPCLEPECKPAGSTLPDSNDLCTICFTSELKDEACVQLGCGHVFHANCILKLLRL